MLTYPTKIALEVLYGVSCGITPPHADQYELEPNDLSELLNKLQKAGLIKLKVGYESEPDDLLAYELTRSAFEISLLDVLEAIGEHLDLNQPTQEGMYLRMGRAANKLGIINQIARTYLSEIKLVDF